jgi:hypothetical protein
MEEKLKKWMIVVLIMVVMLIGIAVAAIAGMVYLVNNSDSFFAVGETTEENISSDYCTIEGSQPVSFSVGTGTYEFCVPDDWELEPYGLQEGVLASSGILYKVYADVYDYYDYSYGYIIEYNRSYYSKGEIFSEKETEIDGIEAYEIQYRYTGEDIYGESTTYQGNETIINTADGVISMNVYYALNEDETVSDDEMTLLSDIIASFRNK